MGRLSGSRCLLAFVLLVSTGCATLIPSPFRPIPGPVKSPQVLDLAQAFDVVCRNYRLGITDVLSLLFQTDYTIPTGSYKLDTLDRIQIKFILDPSLNEEMVIRPDGIITLQAIGEVEAAGLTPKELAKRIEERFIGANIFSRSEATGPLRNYDLVTVHVITFFEKAKQLAAAMTTLTTGQSSNIIVGPDGTIDLPLVNERVIAAGHTVREVEKTVNKLYRDGPLKNAVVSVGLRTANSRQFYVMGQVGGPGAYTITQPITILHAIAMAGGEKPDSDMTSVILISKDVYGKPIGRRIDLKRMLDVGDVSEAILVKPYDVIYVPRTYIQDVRLFMDQYIGVIKDAIGFVNLIGGGG